MRLDSLARYLQDVATDDWADAGLSPDEIWVVRRTTVRVADGGRWPSLGEDVDLTTWCGGTGPAWAERRTDLEVNGVLIIETVALWVPLDSVGAPAAARAGVPRRLRRGGGRSTGVGPGAGRPDAERTATGRPWPIRRADLDIVGHVNNAAVWAAVTEVAGGPVASAALTHHGPLENGHTVTLLDGPGRMCLMTDGETRVSAEFAPL